jgi:hypothetical protein
MFTKKRPDGTYIGNLHFFNQLMPYLLPTRTESAIYFEQILDVTNTLKYLHKRRREKKEIKVTLFYIILYSAIRVITQRPKLNRFVSGYRYYQRNRISFNFVAKRNMTDEGEEINVTMSFSPLLTLEGFCKKIDDYISILKKGTETGAEKINSLVSHLPRFLIKFLIWGLKFLDYHNGLPLSVIDSLPFYNSVFFTNLGSIGMDAPFHHNFELGNCGFFCAIGKLRRENILKKDGTVETHDKIKLTFTYDDRITDGFYCARSIDLLRHLIENPEELENPPELTEDQLTQLGISQKELNNI